MQDDVNEAIGDLARERGVSPDSLDRHDLWGIAAAMRLDAPWLVREDHLLQVANAIDDLSDLGPEEMKYLESIQMLGPDEQDQAPLADATAPDTTSPDTAPTSPDTSPGLSLVDSGSSTTSPAAEPSPPTS